MKKIKQGYVVWFIPKYNTAPTRILKPNNKSITWSKARAKLEAEHFKKHTIFTNDSNYTMPYTFNEVYTYRVITITEAKNKDLI